MKRLFLIFPILLLMACENVNKTEYEITVKETVFNNGKLQDVELLTLLKPIIQSALDNNPNRKQIKLSDDDLIYLLTAMTILESDYLTSKLVNVNNLLGIKRLKKRNYISFETSEFINGSFKRKVCKFAVFYSIEDCYYNWVSLMTQNVSYANFINCKDLNEAIFELAEVYATDPSYGSKIYSIIKNLK